MSSLFKPIQLQEDRKASSMVQLLRTGKFNYDGESLEITPSILASLKINFESKVRGYMDGKLPIDYFHEGDKVAAGWIQNLSLESDGNELWAEVKWTPKAEDIIGGGELRYLSVEYALDYQDNESGKTHGPTLFGAGLTNRPFVKGMKPIVSFSEKNKKLGGYTMNLEQALAKIAELEKELEAAKSGKAGVEVEMAAVKAECDKMKMEAGKKEAAAIEEKALAEKKSGFEKMLSEGKAVEAQREPFMAGNMVKFAELAQPLNHGIGHVGTGTKTDTKNLSDSKTPAQDKLIELATSYARENKVAFKEAIKVVLKANKELNEKYRSETASVKL